MILTMAFALFNPTAYAATMRPVISEPGDGWTEESFDPLQRGSVGENVKTLQKHLIANGYSLMINGEFDVYTELAVKCYQAAAGYDITGVADERTFARLGKVENFLAIADSRLGYRYVRGGKGPNKFDCSGFVYWVLNRSGIEQAYMNSRAWPRSKTYTKIKKMEDLIRGDILCFRGHMAIYLGEGQMINASGSNGKVVIREGSIFESSYWRKVFVCGFRVF